MAALGLGLLGGTLAVGVAEGDRPRDIIGSGLHVGGPGQHLEGVGHHLALGGFRAPLGLDEQRLRVERTQRAQVDEVARDGAAQVRIARCRPLLRREQAAAAGGRLPPSTKCLSSSCPFAV